MMISTRPPNENSGLFDHLALRYLQQSLDRVHPADEPFVMTPTESRIIRRTKIITLALAALIGIIGGLLLYWPQYYWPSFFKNTSITLSNTVYELPLITIFYGILLVYVEIGLLIWLNLLAVRTIMHVCHFPRAHDSLYDRHLQALADATLEKRNRGILRFGIDPYLNMPQWGLSLFFFMNIAKAGLSNLLLKFLLRRFMGRFALRQLTELAGLPIYAIWNAWASWQVLHEAQIRVMAPTTIRDFVNDLYEEWGKNDAFRQHILEALQYVAVLKRQYNYAHFLLTETIMDRFELRSNNPPSGHFPELIRNVSAPIHASLERLIIFGVLVDGRLSWLEKRRLQKLRNAGILSYSIKEIQRIGRAYNQGRGLWI